MPTLANMFGILFAARSERHFTGFSIAWLVHCYGMLTGMALFNDLHQLHFTIKRHIHKYHGQLANQPNPLNQPRRNEIYV